MCLDTMGDNMIDLRTIGNTLLSLEGAEETNAVQNIIEAIEKLYLACGEMDKIDVRGRGNLDKLLGCMLGVEMIIGKEPDDGRQNNQ